MKYLKTYEQDIKQRVFWLLPTDDRYKKALIKLSLKSGVNYNKLPSFIIEGQYIKKTPYIYYGKYLTGTWTFMPYDNGDGAKSYIDNEFIFGGNIDLEDWEFDAYKYNL